MTFLVCSRVRTRLWRDKENLILHFLHLPAILESSVCYIATNDDEYFVIAATIAHRRDNILQGNWHSGLECCCDNWGGWVVEWEQGCKDVAFVPRFRVRLNVLNEVVNDEWVNWICYCCYAEHVESCRPLEVEWMNAFSIVDHSRWNEINFLQ